jgi:hypothetical protein
MSQQQLTLFGKTTFSPRIEQLFDEFWSVLRHRPGDPKKPAKEKFVRLVERQRIDAQEIISGARAFAAFSVNTEPQFLPMTQTWLNQHRWTGDYGTESSRRGSSYMSIAEELFGGDGHPGPDGPII